MKTANQHLTLKSRCCSAGRSK